MYTKSRSGMFMISANGQMQRLKPIFDISQPPRMPPETRHKTPTVPYTRPTSEVVRPSPPAAFTSRRNGETILSSIASPRR
ncbi:MAG: hypothetical protein HZA12_05855 [Nitrospirae bacterium]|nr:hypothetical protein [Nitrospirota bacterium]